MSIISKIFCSILFLIFSLNSVSANQNAINNCNKFDQINKELKIKIIDIEFKNYRRWQVNNIRILTNNSHVIPNQFKKKFRGKLLVTFDNNLICSYDAKIRTHGDLKDHIFYKDGKVFQSLDVQLIKDNINGITKFKLFLKGTRGKEEDEIFMTELLREFDFISPRTELVTVKIYDEDIEMLFQEKITKELLEFNKRREGPIFEGEEKYMMDFASKIQNNPNVNWSEIFRVSEIGSTIQLAKQTNSSWSVKNLINQESSFESLSYLNFIYLVYLNSFKDEKNNYSFLDYNLNNNLLALNANDKIQKLNIYDALILSANGNHALYVHNRKFYWNAIENYFEPIYYDGEFDIQKDPKKLNFPLSVNYLDSIKQIQKKLKKLDLKKIVTQINFRGINFNENIVKKKIDKMIQNLNQIENLYVSISKEEILYNNESYKSKDLWSTYVSNLKENSIDVRFLNLLKSNIDSNEKVNFNVCKNLNDNCDLKYLTQTDIRDLLEGKLNLQGKDYQFIGDGIQPDNNYSSVILNNNSFKNVFFFFNEGIKYEFKKKSNLFEVIQKNKYGRSFFINGKIEDVKINFIGNTTNFDLSASNRIDKKNLTGCLTFIKSIFKNVELESSNSNCEDGINLINTSGNISKILSKNSLYDGIDIDFSSLSIEDIEVKNSLNDCLDFSFGDYFVKNLELNHCGDKGISVGEKSTAKFEVANISNSNIGIASKDSSTVNVNNSNIINTKTCVSAYKKKQEFTGAILKIINSHCKNYNKKKDIDENSKIIFVKDS